MIGTKLAHYEITGHLGTGGMGEVYQATDSKLGRSVAIKLLPAAFASDPERLSRFRREAQLLASLNHPNIAHIYGLEESGDRRCIVMELIEGETLQARIKKGPIPADEALAIAKQIAEALEAAHEKGVIHRDLKPGNLMLTSDGRVKVLDFGLAKAYDANPGSATSSNSPTMASMAATNAGVILGTAAYMSPEQTRGKAVDKRADIWAFGAVLFEMLTGARPFDGEDLAETIGAVIHKEPVWSRLPSGTPGTVQTVLRRCLQKDPKLRLRDAGDVRLALEGAFETVAPQMMTAAPATTATRRLGWIVAFAAALLVAAALVFVHFRETPPPEQTLRYTISAPENSSIHSFAISPDGRTLVIAAQVGGKRQLWLRTLDALQAQPMAFTDDAWYPFWSPDSRYIAFFAQGKLKKVAAGGGLAQSLCDAPNGYGGSWDRNDVIVFSPNNSGISIQRTSASGGAPTDVTKTKGVQVFPVFLPGGSHFLYEARGAAETSGIWLSSLDGQENRRVLPDASGAVFAPSSRWERTGHILFIRENTLMSAPFDPAAGQISGDVVPVSHGVSLSGANGTYLPATASDNGVLLYAAGGSAVGQYQIGWFDRDSKSLGPVGMPGSVHYPAISPDEKSVASARASGGGYDLWLRDLTRGTETRFTSDPSTNITPSWSPKGDRIVFTSNRTGTYNLYQKATSGSGQDEPLLPNSAADLPTQWSRDGRFIVYQEIDPKTGSDLWVLPTEGSVADRKPIPFLRTEASEILGQLSPDSHWMAFTSDRSGKREVYVRPFPPSESEWTVSLAGGEMPRWSGDGKELFFEAADGKMMAVAVKAVAGAKSSFEAGAPAPLFDVHMVHAFADALFEYDVTADGKRFLINTISGSGGGPGAASAPQLTVVTNWTAGLKK